MCADCGGHDAYHFYSKYVSNYKLTQKICENDVNDEDDDDEQNKRIA